MSDDKAHSKEILRLQAIWKEIDEIKEFKVPYVEEAWENVHSKIKSVKEETEQLDNANFQKTTTISPKEIKLSKSESEIISPKPITTKVENPVAPKPTPDLVIKKEGDFKRKSIIVPKPKPTIAKKEKDSIPSIDKIIYGIAALLTLGIMAWGGYALFQKTDEFIDTSTKEQEQIITLSDGSKAVLDPYSKMTYPRLMHEGDRRIALSGDAAFDIMADTEPLIVDVQNLSIKSLGTEFEIEEDEQVVTVKALVGKVRFYETANEENGVVINEGQIVKYQEGMYEIIANYPLEEDVSSEPEVQLGEEIRLDKLLDWLMEKSDWKIVSTPSMPFDRSYVVNMDLSQSYEDVLKDLDQRIDMIYESGPCSGCFLIKKMKASN